MKHRKYSAMACNFDAFSFNARTKTQHRIAKPRKILIIQFSTSFKICQYFNCIRRFVSVHVTRNLYFSLHNRSNENNGEMYILRQKMPSIKIIINVASIIMENAKKKLGHFNRAFNNGKEHGVSFKIVRN